MLRSFDVEHAEIRCRVLTAAIKRRREESKEGEEEKRQDARSYQLDVARPLIMWRSNTFRRLLSAVKEDSYYQPMLLILESGNGNTDCPDLILLAAALQHCQKQWEEESGEPTPKDQQRLLKVMQTMAYAHCIDTLWCTNTVQVGEQRLIVTLGLDYDGNQVCVTHNGTAATILEQTKTRIFPVTT